MLTTVICESILGAWTHWLPGLSDSSSAFLLANLVQRSGKICVDDRGVRVSLQRRPFDVVIEMAGYLETIERVPWLGDRNLSFQFERS